MEKVNNAKQKMFMMVVGILDAGHNGGVAVNTNTFNTAPFLQWFSDELAADANQLQQLIHTLNERVTCDQNTKVLNTPQINNGHKA